MTSEDWLSGPVGPALAILLMALATYACRVSGVILMRHVRATPRVERALAALPGSIVAATVVPLAIRSGPAAVAGILAGIVVMRVVHKEVVGLLVGLAVAAGARAAGL